MKVIERLKKIEEIGTDIEVPYEVWTVFSENCKFIRLISEKEVSLGEDYISIGQAQQALEWYANQLGGKIKWSRK